MRFVLSFFFFFFFVVLQYWPVQAGDVTCGKAESTADLMVCSKARYDKAQERLQSLFETLESSYAKDEKETVRVLVGIQQQWIEHRDDTCAWQVAQVSTDVLKRIAELDCISHITQARANLLAKFLEHKIATRDSAKGNLPMWMNVLGSDYPQTFWRYADHKKVDLNCDGKEEDVIVGMNLQNFNSGQEEDARPTYDTVVAVIDVPLTGRPNVKIVTWEIDFEVCGSHLQTEIVSESEGVCKNALLVKSKDCKNRLLLWDGKRYIQTDEE